VAYTSYSEPTGANDAEGKTSSKCTPCTIAGFRFVEGNSALACVWGVEFEGVVFDEDDAVVTSTTGLGVRAITGTATSVEVAEPVDLATVALTGFV
jgi:hypothetical protein